MGTYCDKCGEKIKTNRVELLLTHPKHGNDFYIVKHYDMCEKCYLDLYKRVKAVI